MAKLIIFSILCFAYLSYCSLILPTPIDGVSQFSVIPVVWNEAQAKVQTITGSLIDGSNTSSPLTGKIVLAERVSAVIDINAYYWMADLPLAVILITQGAADKGSDEFLLDCWSCASDFVVPVASISAADAENLTKAINGGEIVGVTVVFDEQNEFRVIKTSGLWTAGQVIVAAFSAAVVGVSLWKLIAFWKTAGLVFSVGQVSLLIILLAGTISLINWAFDPYFSRRLYPYSFWASFITAPNPMIDIVTMLMALYWFELITLTALRVSVFIAKLAIPFFIYSLVLILIEYIIAIIRSASGATFLIILVQLVITIIIWITIMVFYIITSVKVLKRIASIKGGDAERLKKTTITFVLATFGLLIRICAIIPAILDLNLPPQNFFPASWLAAFSGMWIGLSLALSFQPQHKKYTEYTKSTNSASRTSQVSSN